MKKKDVLNAVNKKKSPVVTNSTKKKKATKNKAKTTISPIKEKKEKPIVTSKKTIPKRTIIPEYEILNHDDISKKSYKKKLINKNLSYKDKIIRFIIVILGLFICFLLFFWIFEYKPKSREKLDIIGEGYNYLNIGDTFTVMSWNIGYGALGDNADFFMDHGKMVQTADRNRVNKNLLGIRNEIDKVNPNIMFLQEVDVRSKRASHMNEYSAINNHLFDYSSSFATNFKVLYIPYPIPNVGNVHSGIATFSKYKIDSSERVQLPRGFIWPISMFQMKRCLLISRLPIENSDKHLVLINLHLEAYDKGKGKEKQTQKLFDILKEEAKGGNYVIAGGDFNQVFSSVDTSMYPVNKNVWKPGKIDVASYEKKWQFVMDNQVPSCRSLDQPYANANKDKFQYYLIDGYIVSNNIEINSIANQDLEFVSSDHNPVVMDVTLK